VVVAMGGIGAWMYTSRSRGESTTSASVAGASPDQAALDDAKRKCGTTDCDGAHDELARISSTSPLRATQDFKDVENRWADQVLARADAEPDAAKKHALYQRVSQDPAVDQAKRTAAANKIQALDSMTTIPTTSLSALPPVAAVAPDTSSSAKPDAARRIAMAPDTAPQAPPLPVPAPTPPPTSVAAATPPKPASAEDRERQDALQATTPDAMAAYKRQLEQKVYSGRASDTEIRLLIAKCKELGDKLCVSQARAIQAQRQQP
jgi:ABC transport system ATP-binding/permease protein